MQLYEELEPDVEKTLKEAEIPELWASALELPGGRGSARRLEIGGCSFLLKRELRGGLSGKVLPGLYFARAAFDREWWVENHLATLDLAPRMVARLFKPSGLLFSVFTLVEFLRDTVSLSELLSAGTLTSDELTVVGAAVGKMHLAGIIHGDLSAGNVLLTKGGDAMLLDFRHSLVCETSPSQSLRRSNLSRLARSLHKLKIVKGLGRLEEPWRPIARGYAEGWGEGEKWIEEWCLDAANQPALRSLLWRRQRG